MKLTFESSPERFGFPFRIIGSAGRYDTLSDCKFLDNTRIVCADRQCAKLYLIEFSLDTKETRILDSLECILEGIPFNFELLYLRSNIVYSVSYSNMLFSCEIVDNKFQNLKSVVVKPGEAYHGVYGAEGDSVYLTNMRQPNITKYDVKTGEITTLVCLGGTRMKDVAIIDDRCIMAISSDSGPISGIRNDDGSVAPHNTPYDSHLLLYEHSGPSKGTLLCRHVLEKTQIDACVYAGGFCFVTCTDTLGNGFLLRCRIDSGYTFTDIVHIPCAGFPHGVSIRNVLFAYTSYTESALYIGRISADGELSEL